MVPATKPTYGRMQIRCIIPAIKKHINEYIRLIDMRSRIATITTSYAESSAPFSLSLETHSYTILMSANLII